MDPLSLVDPVLRLTSDLVLGSHADGGRRLRGPGRFRLKTLAERFLFTRRDA